MDKPGDVASEKLHLQTFENINKVSLINHVLCVKLRAGDDKSMRR